MPSPLHISRLRKWLLSMPPVEWGVQQIRDLLLGAMRQGPVPQHVAFVMDGNRRYAKANGIEVVEGHNLGFEALARILEVCYKVGVKVVTIYAFSIENFKRSKFEVDALMDMAKVKISQLAQHGELLERYGAKLQFLGQRELVRPDVLEVVEQAIALTTRNRRAILNICAPYTSRDEITAAIRNTVHEYNQPIRPKLKRPFSESRIARTIRAQQLATVSEQDEAKILSSSPSSAPKEEDFNYTPSTPDSQATLYQMTAIVLRSMNTLPEEVEPQAADLAARAATDEVLVLLKDPNTAQEKKHNRINDLLSSVIPLSDFAELCNLANNIADFNSPASAPNSSPNLPPTDSSTSTTLNLSTKSHDPVSHPHNFPDPETITAETLTAHTFTGSRTPPLDLLIRTSGVQRLSDFMLWQCHQDTEVVFLKCMWPEFDLWQFLPVVLEWQWRRRKMGINEERAGRGMLKTA